MSVTGANFDSLDVLTFAQSGLAAGSGHLFGAYSGGVKVILQRLADTFAAPGASLSSMCSAVVQLAADAAPVVLTSLHDAGAAFNRLLQEDPPRTLGIVCSGVIFICPQIFLLPILIIRAAFSAVLTLIGFGIGGIVGGSLAASYQSRHYGGYTPAASHFADMQSLGMQSDGLVMLMLGVVRLLAGVVFLGFVLGDN
ncbi:hypothetical protein B0H10DRAFT_2219338 [Mycena sp. CBHHK59/15]|nr:hypothetical protein B0H10DRAFT_2219338 [Mycena sp. CBHHK59/15]